MGILRFEPKLEAVRFVALKPDFAIATPVSGSAQLVIEVDSLRIRVNPGFDSEFLRQVLAVVKRA